MRIYDVTVPAAADGWRPTRGTEPGPKLHYHSLIERRAIRQRQRAVAGLAHGDARRLAAPLPRQRDRRRQDAGRVPGRSGVRRGVRRREGTSRVADLEAPAFPREHDAAAGEDDERPLLGRRRVPPRVHRLRRRAADWLVERFRARRHRLHVDRALSLADARACTTRCSAKGAVILEGLDLRAVSPGEYFLVCAPLNVVGADGAPARVYLLDGVRPARQRLVACAQRRQARASTGCRLAADTPGRSRAVVTRP